MSKPTEKQKELYKKLSPILGVDSKVVRYGDDSNDKSIFILECPDPTDEKVMFYSTIGLMDFPTDSIKYEILLTGYASFECAGNILSSTAFFVIKDNWKIGNGVVFETLVEMFLPNNKDMKHVLFTSPFLWEDKLEEFKVKNEEVLFLLAVPISDAELQYKNQNGLSALESIFEEKNVDIFDLDRVSVL
jgi:hypothetical protein